MWVVESQFIFVFGGMGVGFPWPVKCPRLCLSLELNIWVYFSLLPWGIAMLLNRKKSLSKIISWLREIIGNLKKESRNTHPWAAAGGGAGPGWTKDPVLGLLTIIWPDTPILATGIPTVRKQNGMEIKIFACSHIVGNVYHATIYLFNACTCTVESLVLLFVGANVRRLSTKYSWFVGT